MHHYTRRESLGVAAGLAGTHLFGAEKKPVYQLSTFQAEVTVPLKHPLMGGGIAPAAKIEDPLFANGFVLHGAGKPIVVCVVDWCEIRNDAYTAWRKSLATAAGTVPERVLVSCIHQHDAPIADLEAERILKAAKATGSVCDIAFHDKAVARVAKAVKEAIKKPRNITHLGTGQAKVEKIASNRRYLDANNKPAFGRMSATRNAEIRNKPEGTVDPWLKTIALYDGDKALLSLSCYATHPMSYYGKGGVTADFPGLARKRRAVDLPGTATLYASGCSGNVTAGKYNDGSPGNRAVLADRLYKGMAAAWKAIKKTPLTSIDFRSVEYQLKPREGEFTVANLKKRLASDKKPFGQCLAALGLSWRKRADAGHKLDLPVIDFGGTQLLLLPGESYVEYQLLAQKLRPKDFVMTLGYGESATGYVPTEQAVKENDGNLHDWCWVAPGAEKVLTAAMKNALKA